jgi:hypothetical protein
MARFAVMEACFQYCTETNLSPMGTISCRSVGGIQQSAILESHRVAHKALTCMFMIPRHVVPASRMRY